MTRVTDGSDPAGPAVRTPAGYSRTIYVMRNEMRRAIDDTDAEAMIGAELSFSLHDVAVATGTVTNAVVRDDGRRLELTVESGGRACAACGSIYDDQQAATRLGTVADLTAARPEALTLPVYQSLPAWARVCTDHAACAFGDIDGTGPDASQGEDPGQ